MGEVIDFLQKKNEKEGVVFSIPSETLMINFMSPESKKRTTFHLTVLEAKILYLSYLNGLEGNLQAWQDMSKEEQTHNRDEWQLVFSELSYACMRLVRKLEETKAFGTVSLSWSFRDIHTTLVTLEQTEGVSLEPYELYTRLEKYQKIQIHLYKRIRDLHRQRLQTVHLPLHDLLYKGDHLPEVFKQERLAMEQFRDENDKRYQQEFPPSVVLVEESRGNQESLSQSVYYVSNCPKPHQSLLKALAKKGIATFFSKAMIEEGKATDQYRFQFPFGWRMVVEGNRFPPELKDTPLKVYSLAEREQIQQEFEDTLYRYQVGLTNLLEEYDEEGFVE